MSSEEMNFLIFLDEQVSKVQIRTKSTKKASVLSVRQVFYQLATELLQHELGSQFYFPSFVEHFKTALLIEEKKQSKQRFLIKKKTFYLISPFKNTGFPCHAIHEYYVPEKS